MQVDEREQLKAEIRAEILSEIEKKSHKVIPGLEAVREKWFIGSDKRFKYSGSKMERLFGANQHKVWDAVRAATRLVLGKDYCAQLNSLDQRKVERVADTICETIYSLRKEVFEI